MDERGAVSPDSNHSPEANVEAVNMKSFLEISSQKSMMSDNDDDTDIPKG